MKLIQAEVSHFKNILNSGLIKIEPDVTCIVGKNESGKTAVLHALHRFYPDQPNVSFIAQRQYPAWLEKQHRRKHNLDHHAPIKCYFHLDDPEWAQLESRFGPGVLKSREISISRTYGNTFIWNIGDLLNEPLAVAHIVQGVALVGTPVPTNMNALNDVIEALRKSSHEDEEKTKADRSIAEALNKSRSTVIGDSKTLGDAVWSLLHPYILNFSISMTTVSCQVPLEFVNFFQRRRVTFPLQKLRPERY
jgi:ABC-type cobalamin/Fe3+-siderophores transport system ATPase subunit